MKARIIDPRGPRGKRSSRTIRRFLSVVGLLRPAAARSADRHAPDEPGDRIPVWDARLGEFRDVDPNDRHDPLREPARQLASLRDALCRDEQSPHGTPATDDEPYISAARERRPDDPPHSPFGGGNCVALDDRDE